MNEINENKEIESIKEDKINIKLVSLCLCAFLLVGLIFSFTTLSYKSLMVNFKTNFDNAHYSSANNILITKGNLNLLKTFKLDSDLKEYFSDKLNTISTDVSSGKLKSDDALAIVQEINRYNLLDTEIDKAVEVLSNNVGNSSEISKGISKFEQNDFKGALEIFKAIPKNHESYKTALSYIDKCTEGYINQVIKEADALAAKEYFTQGMNLLNKAIEFVGQDSRITSKLDELGNAKDEYTATINN